VLLTAGANPAARTAAGESPLDLARADGRDENVRVLEEVSDVREA
jgi:ankyrin repeat protein